MRDNQEKPASLFILNALVAVVFALGMVPALPAKPRRPSAMQFVP